VAAISGRRRIFLFGGLRPGNITVNLPTSSLCEKGETLERREIEEETSEYRKA
jgi:hypothetical protein